MAAFNTNRPVYEANSVPTLFAHTLANTRSSTDTDCGLAIAWMAVFVACIGFLVNLPHLDTSIPPANVTSFIQSGILRLEAPVALFTNFAIAIAEPSSDFSSADREL